MPRRSSTRPTDAELEILRVLWRLGPSSVRGVHEELVRLRPAGATAGYTTALKLLQIMTDKGLVRRDESGRAHRYEAVDSAERTQGRLIGDLIERAFGGSRTDLVARALNDAPSSKEELARIRRMLDELERRG